MRPGRWAAAAFLGLNALLAAGQCRADLIAVGGWGLIWQNVPSLAQNPGLEPPGDTFLAAFTAPYINFNSQVGSDPYARYTASLFLGVAPDEFHDAGIGPPSPAFDPNGSLDNTYIRFIAALSLHQGFNTLAIMHDDGVKLDIPDLGFLYQTTAPTPDPATLDFLSVYAPQDGDYLYRLSYGECCGAPARLGLFYEVPEPASLALLGIGLLGLFSAARVREKRLPPGELLQ